MVATGLIGKVELPHFTRPPMGSAIAPPRMIERCTPSLSAIHSSHLVPNYPLPEDMTALTPSAQ